MKKNKDNLGNRMKGYENVSKTFLTRRMPVIVRLDGRSFHTFTKGFKRPFDDMLMKAMWETAEELCRGIQGCKIAYTQSDEISLLLTDYDKLDTSAWFDNNIQKMVSISASIATLAFNKSFRNMIENIDIPKSDSVDVTEFLNQYKIYESKMDLAMFDSRVFTLPKEEVANYFIWRQKDAMRNSVQMVGRANFSHKELHKKTTNDIKDMLLKERFISWDNLPIRQKRGACIVKEKYFQDGNNEVMRSRWVVDNSIPVFTDDRNYIEKFL